MLFLLCLEIGGIITYDDVGVKRYFGGGVLSYCNHSFDNDHIIDLEFGGMLEDFYEISIGG